MAIDAPVILSALFFTIIAIIIASAFLARKSVSNKPEPNQQETKPEEAAEYYQPKAEADTSAPVKEKIVVTEVKKEDPVAIEEMGIADEPALAEDEDCPVQEAHMQAAAVFEVASDKEVIRAPNPVDVFTSEPVLEPLEVPSSKPVPERMPVDTIPELIFESVPVQVSEPPVSELEHEPVQELATEVDSEHASGLTLELAPEPVSETSSETISESIPEQVLEAITEQVSEDISEQVSEDTSEPILEPSAEQISEAVPEPTLEVSQELTPVPEVTVHSEIAAPPVEAEGEAPSFKYGKKRTTKFEKRLTKEELQEEQRSVPLPLTGQYETAKKTKQNKAKNKKIISSLFST
ncbi:hypothetical protein P4O66_007450, partial [Electrophorus voltai]